MKQIFTLLKLKNLMSALFTLLGILCLGEISAQEFLVKSETFTITKAEDFDHDGNSLWTYTDMSEYPPDWTAPYNYVDGQFYIRYEIVSQTQKPGAPGTYRKTKLQFAIWEEPGGAETAGDHMLMNGPGSVQTTSTSLSSWWKKNNTPLDYSQAGNFWKLGLVVWDGETGCMPSTWEEALGLGHPNNCLNPDYDPYFDRGVSYQDYFFPITIRMIVVAVAQGATFSGWANYLNPPATPFTINYLTEKTKENVPATYEYALGTGVPTWPGISGTGVPIDLTLGATYKFHLKTDPAGTYYTLVVPNRPSIPTVGVDFANLTTNIALSSVYKYWVKPDLSEVFDGDGTKPPVVPGQDAYFRFKATVNSFQSSVQHLVIPPRPVAPEYTFSYLTGETNEAVPNTMEYATNITMTGAVPGNFDPVPVVPGANMYFRRRATETAFASLPFLLEIPARPSAPTIGIDFVNKRTSAVVTNLMEYSIDAGFTYNPGIGSYLDLIPGNDVYIRNKSTALAFASNAAFLDVPNLPATPNYAVDFAAVTTDKIVPATDEYSTVAAMTSPTAGNGNKKELEPGIHLYFRTKVTGTSFASEVQHLVVPARPAATAYAVDFATEKITPAVSVTDEYSENASMSGATAGTGTIKDANPGVNLYFRKKATGTTFPSLPQLVNIPARPATPAYAIDYITEKTTTPIATGDEYANSFSMLDAVSGANITLDVVPGINRYFRTKSTGTSFASAVQTLTVANRPAIPSYAIDYTLEKTTASVLPTDEYSTDAAMLSPVTGGNATIDIVPGTTYYFRKKAIAGTSFRSDNFEKVAAARPATPVYNIDFANVATIENVPATVQYDSSPLFSNDNVGAGAKVPLTPGVNMHFRVKPTTESFKSETFSLTVPPRPATPVYSTDFITEKTNANVPATVEYSESANFSGASNGTGAQLDLVPGKTLYFRVKGTLASFPSAVHTLVIPARPAAPAVTIDYVNETTSEMIDNTVEYSASSSMAPLTTGTGAKLTLSPGTDLYLRNKASNTNFYGSTQHLVVPQRPEISSTEHDTTKLTTLTLNITFPSNAPGLEASEVIPTNALLKSLVGNYTLQISPVNEGDVKVNIGANVVVGNNFKANEFKIYFRKSTGFKNLDRLKGVSIFPNPSLGPVTISTSNLSGEISYEVSSLQGKVLRKGIMESGVENIDLGVLPNGIYLVKVSNNGLSTIEKLIIE